MELSEQSFQYLRYLGTLSTGAIALQVGFVERVFPHPRWKALVAISLASFALSVVSSVASQYALLGIFNTRDREQWLNRGGCFVILMSLTFLLGLVSGVIFSIRNLFEL